MRGVAEAFAAAGFHVELPRLPGHGTVGRRHAADSLGRLGSRGRSRVPTAGATSVARRRRRSQHGRVPHLCGSEPIIPRSPDSCASTRSTQPQPVEIIDMLRGLAAGGTTVLPGIGSDIADPDAKESAYDGTPVEPLRSLLVDGIEPLSHEYADMQMPLLLMTSPQDHVVEPGAVRLPGRPLRRSRRADHAGAQLPRRDTGLRQRTHLRVDGRVRHSGRSPADVRLRRQHPQPVERSDRPSARCRSTPTG